MTVQAIRGVGCCARMTPAGDWAFDFALDVAVNHDVRLNVFFFPEPLEAPASRGRTGERSPLDEQQRIDLERRVRLYFDERLGEFLNVGFRLCEGDEEPELQRCLLLRREYDVLVLPYEAAGVRFGLRSIEEFAERMPCPTVLVGPGRPDELYLNAPAVHRADALGLRDGEWARIAVPGVAT